MWIVAEYQPTTLFSLRPATATTSGGKSLIVPTAFAIKMALLDAVIRTQGVQRGEELFATIRDLRIGLLPPQNIVVNSTFTKILRLKEIKTKASEKAEKVTEAQANQQWPFQRTIAYREYVQLGGPLAVALLSMTPDVLTPMLLQINYLGKRGGFIQLLGTPQCVDVLPDGFTEVTASVNGEFPLGVLQVMDDFGPKMVFEHANVYSDKGIKLGKDRILHHVVLPYKLVSSSRGYSLYERFEP